MKLFGGYYLMAVLLLLALAARQPCADAATTKQLSSSGARSRAASSSSSTTLLHRRRTSSLPSSLATTIPRGGARNKPAAGVAATAKNKYKNTEPLPVGTASIPSEVFNLIKCIVGAGVLGLPSGIAAFGDSPSAILPALVLLATIGFLSSYGFSVLGYLCGATASTTYRQAWRRSVGDRTSWMPAMASFMVCCCSVITYSMILSDTIPAIVKAFTGVVLERNPTLLGLTLLVLLPLCLLRELKSLAPFSLIGTAGVVYTGAVMMYRWLSGGYSVATDTAAATTTAAGAEQAVSKLASSLSKDLLPRFGNSGWKAVFSSNTAIVISMMSTAFMAHYNAPKLFWELRDNTLPRFNTVIAFSFAGAVLLMATIAAAGFGTFGAASSSLILNNYAVDDTLMSVSRIAVTVSLICSYPLAFVGVREGLLDLLSITDTKQRESWSNPLTIGMLAIVTGLAFSLTDIKIVLALGGATWGNCVIYLFPAWMLIQYAAQNKQDVELQRRVPRAVLTGLLGLALGILGTVQALK